MLLIWIKIYVCQMCREMFRQNSMPCLCIGRRNWYPDVYYCLFGCLESDTENSNSTRTAGFLKKFIYFRLFIYSLCLIYLFIYLSSSGSTQLSSGHLLLGQNISIYKGKLLNNAFFSFFSCNSNLFSTLIKNMVGVGGGLSHFP